MINNQTNGGTMNNPSLDTIRAHAFGKWASILAGVGIPDTYLNTRRHMPCPTCGGRDRYRFTDFQGNGGFICNQCSPNGGSGFDLIMLVYGCSFSEAVNMVSEYLGLTHKTPNIAPKRLLPIEQQIPSKDNIKRIQGFLEGCQLVTRHCPVGSYLSCRGLDWDAISDGLSNIFYRQSLEYWVTDSFGRPFKVGSYPAMIATITKDSELMGVHITYLEHHKDH